MDYRIKHVKTTGSSNDDIRELGMAGEDEGIIVWTDEQTNGKGRSGRTWESKANENLYFSLLLKPTYEIAHTARTTIIMALAVAKGVSKLTGAEVLIKWPNDVVINGKKICGILTELYLRGDETPLLIPGTGVNVNQTIFPDEIKEKATSLLLELGVKYEIEDVLHAILEEFAPLYEEYLKHFDLSFMKADYEAILANMNKRVHVLDPKNPYDGVARGITDTGELIVETDDNKLHEVYAGEVHVRGIYGYV